jgi:hypothetical protein
VWRAGFVGGGLFLFLLIDVGETMHGLFCDTQVSQEPPWHSIMS